MSTVALETPNSGEKEAIVNENQNDEGVMSRPPHEQNVQPVEQGPVQNTAPSPAVQVAPGQFDETDVPAVVNKEDLDGPGDGPRDQPDFVSYASDDAEGESASDDEDDEDPNA